MEVSTMGIQLCLEVYIVSVYVGVGRGDCPGVYWKAVIGAVLGAVSMGDKVVWWHPLIISGVVEVLWEWTIEEIIVVAKSLIK